MVDFASGLAVSTAEVEVRMGGGAATSPDADVGGANNDPAGVGAGGLGAAGSVGDEPTMGACCTLELDP